MTIQDKNQTLQPPAGHAVHNFTAEGAYLRAEYIKFHPLPLGGHSIVVIYLNDQGREVARSITEIAEPPKKEVRAIAPINRWMKLWNKISLGW